MALSPARYRFSVEDFYRMAGAGLFSEDDRLELLEGEVVEMTPIGSQHAGAVNWLNRWFQAGVGARAVVAVQNPLRLGDHSELQPDVALLRPRADLYARSHPSPDDALLVVEVCDSTCDHDRTAKAPLYARAGVVELWVVDLAQGVVEVHTEPSARGFRQRRVAAPGERVAPRALPEVELEVDALLAVEAPERSEPL